MPGSNPGMSLIRRAILSLALIAGSYPAFAQVPPPVPALPDTERRTTYVIAASTCACNVNFALYGDSTDVTNWIEVFVNGVKISQSGNWTITSPANPAGLANAARPITDAVLTFTAAQTGTVQIVGARRPRRASQFPENRGVAARDFNQVITDLTAQNRETWDKINDVTGRTVQAPPGETLALLPILANRQNLGACFDNGGNLSTCVALPSGGITAGNGITFTGTSPTTISITSPVTAANGGTGVNNSTNSTNDVLASNGTNGSFVHSLITSVINGACSVIPTTCGATFGYLMPEWYGAVGDCVTDDQVSITNAITAAVAQKKRLNFSRSCYGHVGTLAFGFDNLEVTFAGFVTLKTLLPYTGINVSIDAGPLNTQFLRSIRFGVGNPPYLTGHATSLQNLFIRSANFSFIEARGGDAATTSTGIEVDFAVGSFFRFIYDGNGNGVPLITSKAQTAILLRGRTAGEPIAGCQIYVAAESMVNGVVMAGVNFSNITGFSENNSVNDLFMQTDGAGNGNNNNVITDFDIEGIGAAAGLTLSSGTSANTFLGISIGGTKNVNIVAGNNRNVFYGGLMGGTVTDNGTNTIFENMQAVTFNPNATTSWTRVYNGAGVYYADRTIPPVVFANLPTCNAASTGARAFITDSNVTLTAGIGAGLGSGGANKTPVHCDGTIWRYG